MAQTRRKWTARDLAWFYRFALPHWKWIALAIFGMGLYAMVSFNVLILIKPMVENLEQRETGSQTPDAATPVPRADQATPPADQPKGFIEKTKQEGESWLMSLRPLRAFMNWLAPGDDPGDAMQRMALFIAFVIGPLFIASAVLKDYAAGRVVWSITADVRMAVFNRLTDFSLSYFGRQRAGELISRLTNDINSTRDATKILFGKILLQPLMFVVFLCGALRASPQLTLIALAALPVLVVTTRIFGKKIRRYGLKTLQKLADITDAISQMLSGIRVVKSFHMEEAEREEFRRRNRSQLKKAFRLVRNRAWASALPEFFLLLPLVLMLLVANKLIGQGQLTFGGMIEWGAAVLLMSGPLRRVVKAYNNLEQSMAGVLRLREVLEVEPEIQDSPDACELTALREGVRFNNVSFAYEAEPVLRGIDLYVPRGGLYAIVGETGAGKSTMLDLVARFYDTTQGSIEIDGTDIRRIKRSSLMAQIAIVGQHPFLFNRSIAENIRYGKPDATDEEVVAAARAAQIHRFVEGLPDGYDTVVGEAGDRLSGGQRQCVTIARAILKNAPILILDEATSNLDAESERLVQEALDNLMKDRTTFVIAHRLSTVRGADRIVVLSHGAIVEQGTHAELIHGGGVYEHLYRLQFGLRVESPGAESEIDADSAPADG